MSTVYSPLGAPKSMTSTNFHYSSKSASDTPTPFNIPLFLVFFLGGGVEETMCGGTFHSSIYEENM